MISNDAIRRNMAVFSMSVSKLTDLTPRQIRYETHELIKPERTEGQNVVLTQ